MTNVEIDPLSAGIGCGCVVVMAAAGLAAFILCCGAAWWLVSGAWQMAFGG